MDENAISRLIVEAAIEVHRTLGGPGLLECVYEEAFVHELTVRELMVERQLHLPIHYKGRQLGGPLRIDLRIESCVLVEIKAVAEYHQIFSAQMLTYLKLSALKLGLVLNFGERYVKDGIHRVVNGL